MRKIFRKFYPQCTECNKGRLSLNGYIELMPNSFSKIRMCDRCSCYQIKI